MRRINNMDTIKFNSHWWRSEIKHELQQSFGHVVNLVYVYLTTTTYQNAISVAHIPAALIAFETGLEDKDVMEVLHALEDKGIVKYDHVSGYLWIIDNIKSEFGDRLSVKDNRVHTVRKLVDAIPDYVSFKNDFISKYEEPYKLTCELPAKTKASKNSSKTIANSNKDQQSQSEENSSTVGDNDAVAVKEEQVIDDNSEQADQEQEQEQFALVQEDASKTDEENKEAAKKVSKKKASKKIDKDSFPPLTEFKGYLPTSKYGTKGEVFEISEEFYDFLFANYENVDTDQCFKNIFGWCRTNKGKRKTLGGMERFVTGWFSRSQNKGDCPRGGSTSPVSNDIDLELAEFMNPDSDLKIDNEGFSGNVFDSEPTNVEQLSIERQISTDEELDELDKILAAEGLA